MVVKILDDDYLEKEYNKVVKAKREKANNSSVKEMFNSLDFELLNIQFLVVVVFIVIIYLIENSGLFLFCSMTVILGLDLFAFIKYYITAKRDSAEIINNYEKVRNSDYEDYFISISSDGGCFDLYDSRALDAYKIYSKFSLLLNTEIIEVSITKKNKKLKIKYIDGDGCANKVKFQVYKVVEKVDLEENQLIFDNGDIRYIIGGSENE